MVRHKLLDSWKDEVLLLSRLLLVTLFIVFGWMKLNGFSQSVAHLASMHRPFPAVGAITSIVMELLVGSAIAVGFYTRPLALVLAAYALSTALLGHRFWNLSGMQAYSDEIEFFKNVSIMGGLILLSLSGPGKYSFDSK